MTRCGRWSRRRSATPANRPASATISRADPVEVVLGACEQRVRVEVGVEVERELGAEQVAADARICASRLSSRSRSQSRCSSTASRAALGLGAERAARLRGQRGERVVDQMRPCRPAARWRSRRGCGTGRRRAARGPRRGTPGPRPAAPGRPRSRSRGRRERTRGQCVQRRRPGCASSRSSRASCELRRGRAAPQRSAVRSTSRSMLLVDDRRSSARRGRRAGARSSSRRALSGGGGRVGQLVVVRVVAEEGRVDRVRGEPALECRRRERGEGRRR